MLLSACLIVKNEARFLDGCLASIQDLVDEVVVVDTGSTDRTKQIARQWGARLHDFEWADDFAAARNHALDRARGQWILYIDADERVRPASPSRLRGKLSNASYVAYYVLLHSRPRFTPYWEMRLFRNHPSIRFRGVIHENTWPGIDAYRAARGGRIGRSGLIFDHEGDEGDQTAKHRRNLPLLKKRLRADPIGVYSWCHLASIYAALGQDRLDVDVVEYPADIIEALLATGKHIVQPHCVLEYGGSTFDQNAWREHGRVHLDALRDEGELARLDAVGATMLLVRADIHRDGLVFPPFPYGRANPLARPGRGELETEGLGLLAHDMGHQCWGMPNLEIKHVRA